MGPAFAHHFSSDGEVVKPASSTRQCGTVDDGVGNTFNSPTPIPGAINAPGSKPGAYIYYRLSTYSCKDVVVPAERRGWEGNNPALGLRYTRRLDDHSNTFLFSWVRDSYGTSSVMLAAGRMWPVLDVDSVKVDAGVVGGLWYRSVLNRSEDGLVRRVVPFALPSMAITETHTGLGVDLGFAPRLAMNGYTVNRTPTLMVQLNYLVKKTQEGDTSVSLQRTTDGGLQGSVARTF
ncbi:hypothetical protein ACG04R_16535 [Roseateles sp. BYS78W]|uniref:Uncharacterized protein n=1 Tax=Pelomonas candidula TaxID=3299025 RepID=A0ABW7HF16_9BURK